MSNCKQLYDGLLNALTLFRHLNADERYIQEKVYESECWRWVNCRLNLRRVIVVCNM